MDNNKNIPSIPVVDNQDGFRNLHLPNDPRLIKIAALDQMIGKKEGHKFTDDKNDAVLKAMALYEFDKGVLMSMGLTDTAQPFAIQLSQDYQKEYKCETVSRRSLAELAALNYCRILDIQRRISSYLGRGEFTDMGVKYLSMLSKDLDRAQRHYLTSMHALEMGLQQPLTVSIRTNTANIAGQQAIQQVGEQTNVKG